MSEPLRVAGMVWYRLENYEDCMAVMADRHLLPKTFASWRMQAEQAEKKFRREGWTTTRVYIEAAEFVAWCKARGLNVDAAARTEFANAAAKQAAADLG